MKCHQFQRKENSTSNSVSLLKDHSTLFLASTLRSILTSLTQMLSLRLQMARTLNNGGSTRRQKLSNLGKPDHTLSKFNQMENQTTWLLQVPILNGGNSSNMTCRRKFSTMSRMAESFRQALMIEKAIMLVLARDRKTVLIRCGKFSMPTRLRRLEPQEQTLSLALISIDHST